MGTALVPTKLAGTAFVPTKLVGTALVPTKIVGTAVPTNLSEQTTWCSNRK